MSKCLTNIWFVAPSIPVKLNYTWCPLQLWSGDHLEWHYSTYDHVDSSATWSLIFTEGGYFDLFWMSTLGMIFYIHVYCTADYNDCLLMDIKESYIYFLKKHGIVLPSCALLRKYEHTPWWRVSRPPEG